MSPDLSMLANFYYEVSHTAVVIGVVAGLGLVIALGFTRRPLLSALCSAVGWGIIAFCVWACGDSDSFIGLLYLGYVPLAALVGFGAGLIFAELMRGLKKPVQPQPNEPQNELRDAP